MNPHGPHDQRGTTHWRADEAAMDTFTLRLPRWPVLLRLLGRDPLVRTTDRIEALVLVLAVVVSLLAIPITAAVGTAVYDSRRQAYAEQADTRHTVTATVTDVPASQQSCEQAPPPCRPDGLPAAPNTPARSRRNRQPKLATPLRSGSTTTERRCPHQPRPRRAAVEAVTGALVIWISVAAIAATLFTLTRAVCDRIRFTGWQHDLDSLVGNGDGHQYPGRTSER